MKISKKGVLFLVLVSVHIIIQILIAFLTRPTDIALATIRIGALVAATLIFYTIIMSLYLRQITKNFGTTFINIHHFFAISGMGLIILHGLAYVAYYYANDFLAFFNQLAEWWIIISIIGLTLIVIGVIAVLLRKKLKNTWRTLHILNYFAYASITAHAILINTDFQTLAIFGIYLGMLIVVMVAFIIKRIRAKKLQKKIQSKVNPH